MPISFTPTVVPNPKGAQGSYPLTMAKGHEGLLADLRGYRSTSWRNESGAPIPFGVLVSADLTAGKDPFSAIPTADATAPVAGVTLDSFTFEGASQSTYTASPSAVLADGRVGYPDTQVMNLLTQGVVMVYVTEAVGLDSAVRFWISDQSGTTDGAFPGRFCTSASAGNTIAISAGARFVSSTTEAGLAILEIDCTDLALTAD